MKRAKRIIGWCSQHILITNLLAWALELCAAVLVWLLADVSDVFPTTGTYIFFWLTLFAAFTAALNSVFASMSAHNSLTIANEGLALTRATQRPFLNVLLTMPPASGTDLTILKPEIQNTGNLPAEKVIVNCEWYIQEDNGKQVQTLKNELVNSTILFPGDITSPTYLVDGEEAKDRLGHTGSRFRVNIEYQNRITSQKHHTIRTFRTVIASGHSNVHTRQAIPIPEDDDWD